MSSTRSRIILNLYEQMNDRIKMPDIILDQNKNYEIGIHAVGVVITKNFGPSAILDLTYDGIRAMQGPNPYTVFLSTLGTEPTMDCPIANPIFYPLRTNQLGSTSFNFNLVNGGFAILNVFMQIEIREENGKNQ